MTLLSSPIFFFQNFILQLNCFVTCFFPTLLYVAFLVNKCICATSFFLSCSLCFFNLFLIEGKLLHNIVLASAIHQDESAIGMHVSPPSLTSLPPPTPLGCQSPGLSSLSHTANFHWLSVLHMVVYTLPCYSLHLSHPLLPPPWPVSISLHLHCCPVNRFLSTIFLHIYGLIHDISLSDFTLYNRLQLHPPLFRTDSNAFLLWLSNVPLYVCTTVSLSTHLMMDIQVAFISQLL